MGDINRWQGQAKGRNRVVEHGGTVYTVATAGAPGRDIQEQTKLVLEAIDQNLADVGTDKTRIVSAQIFMEDMDQKSAMDVVWCDWAGDDWRNWPQRACVGAKLAPNTLVEIIITAAKA
ncbi:RidA family protein [Alphaproteobacteria bacterium]|jgi:enamine deaminase RidA (YjgF/YER057c/UK114 family)|nr:RidA family protein [Alphaproteobacteria bacterium]